MLASIGKWLVASILKPLVEKLVVGLYKKVSRWISEYFRKKKLKKENDAKVEAFKESETDEDIIDTHSNLP